MPTRFVRVIASRGDARNAPENTRKAFQSACKAGVDELHVDVRLSKDGHPVLCRDASLFRTTGREELVQDLTLAEIQALDAGIHFPGQTEKAQVLSLQDFVRQWLPKARLIIEPKENGTILPLVKLFQGLVQQGAFERVVAISQERCFLSALRMLDARVRLGQILERRSQVTNADVKFFGGVLVLPFWEDAADKGYVDDAHRLGLLVYAWGAENLEEAKAAIAGGVDGVLYENPTELLGYLKEAGLREEPVVVGNGNGKMNGKPVVK